MQVGSGNSVFKKAGEVEGKTGQEEEAKQDCKNLSNLAASANEFFFLLINNYPLFPRIQAKKSDQVRANLKNLGV